MSLELRRRLARQAGLLEGAGAARRAAADRHLGRRAARARDRRVLRRTRDHRSSRATASPSARPRRPSIASSRYRPGTVGPALPGTELRLGEDGELFIRSPTVFAGYLKDETATREVLDDEGWLSSGDIAEIDADGFVTITDRKKDILVTAGGKNVAPANIENDLKVHREISQALVVGDRRPFVAALVTLDPDATRRADGRAEAAADPGDRRRREPRALALRADQALRDPAAGLLDGRGRGDADAEAQAQRRARALRARGRVDLRPRECGGRRRSSTCRNR